MKSNSFSVLFLTIFISLNLFSNGKRALTFDDLISCKRITDADLSPDGKSLVFTIMIDDEDSNSFHSDIWIVSIYDKEIRKLTNHEKSSWHPKDI